jgi:hypothetical protein
MIVHGSGKLGPAGRFALAEAIAEGNTQKATAELVLADLVWVVT